MTAAARSYKAHSKMKFSPQQQAAIDKRGVSIMLGAAAGSGKTTVMVSRIMKMLTDGDCTLDQLLVLTFTRAAASNMRTKLEKELSAALAAHPGDPRLARAARDLPCAQISTFDSFCTTLVRRYFFLLDIHADARMLDENEQEELENSVMCSVLENASAIWERGEFDGLELLYDLFSSGKNDAELMQAVLSIYRHCQLYPRPEERLERLCGDVRVDDFVLSDLELLKKRCSAARDILQRFASLAGLLSAEKERIKALDLVKSDGLVLEQIMSAGSIDSLRKIEFIRMPTIKEEPLHTELKALRELLKNTLKISETVKSYSELNREQLDTAGRVLGALGRLVRMYSEELRDECLSRNVLTFTLAQRLAMELTEQETVLEELRGDYRYIFIDEDQDSNRLQRCMTERLVNSDESNLFMVGDIKQSIYRFRNAEPGMFLAKTNDYRDAPEGSPCCVLRLNNNFRSHKNILECINLIFRRNMRSDFFELDYNSDEELRAPEDACWQTDDRYALPTRVVLLKNDTGALQDELDRAEAREAAALCLEFLGSPIAENGGTRPARFGDMVVLHRNANKKSAVFAEEFRRAGIPFSASSESSPLESYEVSCVLDLLRLLDNRRNDFALFSAMRLYGFTLDDIISIRSADIKSSFCDCILNSRNTKVTDFLTELERLRFLCSCRPVWKLLWEIYDSTGFFARCAALPGGRERTDNLRALAALAEKYCSGEGMSLHGFINLCSTTGKRALPGDPLITGDKVHMLTVHKSKGLEFPIVIMAGCGDKLFKNPSKEKIRISRDLGITFKAGQQDAPLCRCLTEAADRRERYFERSEQLRSLYVAATRAVNRLVFTGIYTPRPYGLDAVRFDAERCFDFILPPLLDHPDGASLAQALDILPQPGEASGRWEWQLLPVSGIREVKYALPELKSEACSQQEIRQAAEDFRFSYKYSRAAMLPGKKSASDAEKSYELAAPDFSDGISAAGIGSAYHLLLEHTDFRQSAAQTCKKLTDGGLLDEKTAGLLDLGKLDRLINSPLGRKLAEAHPTREAPFTMLEEQDGEHYIVQGIIDCFYVENGKAVLLDFKSDRVHNNISELRQKYLPQLELYRKALRKCFNLECARSSLYLLDIGCEVEIYPGSV